MIRYLKLDASNKEQAIPPYLRKQQAEAKPLSKKPSKVSSKKPKGRSK